MGDKNHQLMLEAYEEVYGGAEQLLSSERWKDRIEGIKDARPDVAPITLINTAKLLENTYRHYYRKLGVDPQVLMETTYSTAIGNYIQHGFDLIAAVMPSLIANDVVSVQALTRRKGEAFFLEYLYGTTKGRIQAQSKMFSTDVTGNAEIWYSHETVPEEQINQNGGSAGKGPFTGSATDGVTSKAPMRPGTLVLTMAKDGGGTLRATDDGANTLIGTDVDTGTINYTNGAISVTWKSNAAANAWLLATYRANFEKDPSLIPEVEISITSAAVEAVDRKMRALWNLDFSFDLQQAFGLEGENVLNTGLASELRKEIDGEMLQFLYDSCAAAAPADWPMSGGQGVSYNEHKWTFIDAIIEASNNIFDATRRATGNFIVAGLGVCNVIESLAPRFKRGGRIQPGPHFLGTIDDTWKVYKNPFYPRNEYVVGYKGDTWVEAGAVYLPYMPFFMTKPIMLDDFENRKGIATAYAKHLVNGYYYTKGEITPAE